MEVLTCLSKQSHKIKRILFHLYGTRNVDNIFLLSFNMEVQVSRRKTSDVYEQITTV